ncbi:IS256 family transposase [Methanoculleus sp. FWC-SCC1]|uniref:IS256 family transposase n=1 Tax=Methanoculleus frigidifontis TaxID=2584085 RepID=A0ABT8M7E4_9EURY|nr:IS256 family transposase [Methanoculleus sp. FWC-SCC1]MDN7023850.1 IS256 family transposase [Methanoculleus sp. FWC-SCC1]
MIPLAFIEDYLSDEQAGMLSVLTWFLNQVLRHEADQQVGAGQYERSETRKAHRNGYKERSLKTRYGNATLKKPQFREFPFETQVFGRYARVEKALVNAVVESYLQGVSTRRVQAIVQHLGIEQLSSASVSRMAKELDDQVSEFLMRPIEQAIPYLYVDASYFKVRDGARYVTKAVLVVAGVRDDGYREILGARITDCENEEFWSGLFEDLKDRGLTGVQLIISDGHAGIQKAAEAAFLGASWQMCEVHCTRAVLKNIPRKGQKEVVERLREAYGDEQKLQDAADDLNERGYRKAANTIERFLPGLISYTAFPKRHWKRIRTTNMMERTNRELKRRTKVVGVFPNEESLFRLVGSILMDVNEDWVTGKKYLQMDEE